jgi:RND family efflux transporter MFP subunit
MKRTHIIGLASLAVALVAGGLLLVSHGQHEPAQAQPPAPALAVQTTSPETRSVSRLISLPGDVQPWEEATLYAKVPGYLGAIAVDKGDQVKAGQVLATIQAPELQADRDQALQTYQSALAAAQGSRATHERTEAEQQRARAAADRARADYAQTTVAIARAKAQLKAAQGAVKQAEEQKNQAAAALEESQAQVERARADLEGARADQKLADVTYERYQGIYDKNPMLLARQDLDVAESRAKAARSKTLAAQSTVEVTQRHVQAAQAQVKAAASQVEQAQSQVEAAQDQVSMMVAQQTAGQKQVEVAAQDVAISAKQQGVTRAKAQETRFQANAGRSALGRTAVVAEYARIHAPFSGVVTKRFVDTGAFIQTASASQNAAPIVTVANMDSLRVYVNVPELEAQFVKAGTPVSLSLPGVPDRPIKAQVTRTPAILDPKTRTLLAEVDLPNKQGSILPGAYATVKVALETHPNVTSIPSAAVGADKTGKFVYVVVSGKAKRVAITIGFDDGAFTEIVSGLHGGEQVVVTGRDALSPNAIVTTTPWIPQIKK